jgi:ABC-type multidrug transport system fused ATPase/permease subunit
MPINITENLNNITAYLERSNFADYVSNPLYMSLLNSVCLFIMIIIIGKEITVGLIFFILIYSFIMFFTFSYAYKKTVKPKESNILQPGISATMNPNQMPIPRTSVVPQIPQTSTSQTSQNLPTAESI